ncbi:hypothetical protein AB6A40_003058 [Gnathostoma spinigerum]|uniref:Cyclin-like domain-containing protein n=1 Tax=Gnathostoma spinigerum TaxID=75299 RepID=A0ABD6E8F2_9BILA
MGNGCAGQASLLRSLLDRQNQFLMCHTSLPAGNGLVTMQHRQEQVAWIISSSSRLGLGIDTVSGAVAVFDCVLLAARVPVRYVNCVAATCLYLAIKLCEECIVHVSDAGRLISRLQLTYSISELNRMELAILKRLNWDIRVPAIDKFIDAMLSTYSYRLLPIRESVECVLSSQLTFKYLPSVLALAIISLLLEYRTKLWFTFTVELQRFMKIDEAELIACREDVAEVLGFEDKENLCEYENIWPALEDSCFAEYRMKGDVGGMPVLATVLTQQD